jgi:hypothetical protein
MRTPVALFPTLLGEHWPALALPVRQMHGDAACVRARGRADVEGAMHLPARLLRRWLGLPPPGVEQALEVTIERDGRGETWTRQFATRRMRSTLTETAAGRRLSESFGLLRLHFELDRDGQAIDWRLCGARVLGLPVPCACIGHVFSRSDSEGGRYTFRIDARLPLLGRLIAYRGWLEVIDA